jgi:ATP-dependent helicase/nuclease subunit A
MEAAQDLELKREMDAAGDAVRVMTVHGAKGLEAPFVILPDTGPMQGGRGEEVIRLAAGDPDAPPLALWSAPTAEAAAPVAEAKEAVKARAEEESRRLLYVALTRAESRLLVAGALPKRGGADGSWHAMIEAGLRACGAVRAEAPAALEEGDRAEGLRLAERWHDAGAGGPAAAAAATAEAMALPTTPPPRGAAPAPRVNASALGEETAVGPAAPTAWDRETARLRGDAIHMLLEWLPELAPEARAAQAEAWLAAGFPALPEAVRAGCVAEAQAALAHPDAAPFLGAEALAEAGLTALLPGGARMTGRVDRLLVGADSVRLLDWKTGPAPASPAETPESYLRQMAAYREALRALHPGKAIEAALFWTGETRFDPLPDAALDAALARLSAAPPEA